MRPLPAIVIATFAWSAVAHQTAATEPSAIAVALEHAGENAAQLQSALEQAPDDQKPGVEFLIANMPDRDRRALSAEFLLENTDYAYRVWRGAPWRDQVDERLFLNDVLPYSCVTERRENWRRDFYERFRPLVEDATSPGEAAAILNNKIFAQLEVSYNTKRRRTDQSPSESIETGMATCTGLSILLIDACRAVGVPARFVGTPLWSDNSGNHSWVEVWDGGQWRYTGAAEADGKKLDSAWFADRASLAKRDVPRHAIYATSFKRTPISFPCVWAPGADYVSAVNVTDRYTLGREAPPDGMARARFRVVESAGGDRCACSIRVKSKDGKVWLAETTRDERFDLNDHASAMMPLGAAYVVQVDGPQGTREVEVQLSEPEQLFTINFESVSEADKDSVVDPVEGLRKYLAKRRSDRKPLADQPFAGVPLSKEQFELVHELMWADHVDQVRQSDAAEFEERVLRMDDREMPFAFKTFGEVPEDGHSLYISMHGGGNAPAQVNTGAWKRHQTLYEPTEGVYLAPRAPTDSWNMWHQENVDRFFRRLIADMIVFEGIDPNRVYLMGYSAGGDGVYQLAPRMADALAAAAMMAGHPNEASPLGLRNIPFALYMGADDAAYNRNKVAAEWRQKLARLQDDDPGGYHHLVEIFPGKGHWMDRLDASAVGWMQRFVRNPTPTRVVWFQDDVTRRSFYWLGVDEANAKQDALVVAEREGQEITVSATGVQTLRVRLDDRIVDMDQTVRIVSEGHTLFEGVVPRTIATVAAMLAERGDPEYLFAGEVEISMPEGA